MIEQTYTIDLEPCFHSRCNPIKQSTWVKSTEQFRLPFASKELYVNRLGECLKNKIGIIMATIPKCDLILILEVGDIGTNVEQ